MGAAYAGVMDGDMCGCGSDDGYLESAKTSGTCFTECTGDDGRTEYCGGSDSFGLFRIIYGGTAIANSESFRNKSDKKKSEIPTIGVREEPCHSDKKSPKRGIPHNKSIVAHLSREFAPKYVGTNLTRILRGL